MILRLVLGDQLNPAHGWFRSRRADVVYVMMEVRSETDYVLHHAQKLLAVFASMRNFAAALQAAGHAVRYLRISDPANRLDFLANLRSIASEIGATSFERMQSDEWRLETLLDDVARALALPHAPIGSEHFLLDRERATGRFRDGVPRLEVFYREQRREFDILMTPQGQPEGDRWNFDADNRARWPGTPAAPEWPWQGHDLSELWSEIQSAGIRSFGAPSESSLRWPLGRREARTGLAHFITHALPEFGRYQDALTGRSDLLFHSALSFALNVKMLHPMEVINAAVEAWRNGLAPLNSVEGFVRQILGWREYMRAVYWSRMPLLGTENALNAKRALPSWYWSGETRMACLSKAITQSLERAYAHHIQRLMVTGNFALLAGCDPDEVDAWYLGIYIDAFEWVEMPNTRAMSQFADGGIVGSKPYCGSASYINRQSDHCRGCHYDPKLRHGERACPFNSLYWHFHDRHRDVLGSNPRLRMPYQLWDGMPPDERSATLAQAERYLADVDAL
ncbi:cryptochrome/photolyase family protein [soil metagenome]